MQGMRLIALESADEKVMGISKLLESDEGGLEATPPVEASDSESAPEAAPTSHSEPEPSES
jgi:DNA gyrase subunit A